MNLKIMPGGQKLHWYDPGTGVLLTEFFFLGTAK
jgi:hypothetical protein